MTTKTPSRPGRPKSTDLVLTWAVDAVTHKPVYIGALARAQNGARCGCVCPSCGSQLQAVNAGKDTVVMRPHFRHEVGFERKGCAGHSARLAALATLTKTGWIDLPGRRIPAQVTGLSGQVYLAPETVPRQRLRLVDLNLSDRTRALLTLEDGRQLVVVLVGEPGGAVPGRAVVSLELPDSEVEAVLLDAESIWDRLSLLPDLVCWHSDWDEAELQQEASELAQQQAVESIDAYANAEEAALCARLGLHGREGLVHLLAKLAIQEAGRLHVPAADALAAHAARYHAGGYFDLSSVRLEERQSGRFVPDLALTVAPNDDLSESQLFVEVIVTSAIDDAKHAKLIAHGVPTLMIDFRQSIGRISRDTLRHLVVDDLRLKSWVQLPQRNHALYEIGVRLEPTKGVFQDSLDLSVASADHDAVPGLLDAYLATVQEWLVRRSEEVDGNPRPETWLLMERLSQLTASLSKIGYPESAHGDLIEQRGILGRILAMKLNRGVGDAVDSAVQVLNALKNTRPPFTCDVSLMLIAYATYRPPISPRQSLWVNDWINGIRQQIQAGNADYLRDGVYDRLLSRLFPQMADGLKKVAPLRFAVDADVEVQDRYPAWFLSDQQPLASSVTFKLTSTFRRHWWLRGVDLDRWLLETGGSSRSSWQGLRLVP